ncbi:glycerophosphodiester phosphodiesterase [Paraburkholderia sp. J8-2]|uniref:glycerophosphodiester phosphodiesterase n=1 Tax=Paraburkholderia sp. J8-2 TaxID=2805440 RepID=UPI002AB60A38|nr:glycerophosphodiester phosphodiesterase family protein [Paraburkholderia sp. J8-2]
MSPLLRSSTGKIHICGHRGHSTGAPENTLAAFRAARALGGTTCETDLVLSADGELVLVHDETVDRTSDGKGLVSKMKLAQLKELDAGSWFSAEFAGERVPTLREALVLAREIGLTLQVELKIQGRDDELFPKTAALLDELDAHDLVTFSSFDFKQLRDIKLEIPKVPTVGITHSRLIDPVSIAREALMDAVSIEWPQFPAGDAIRLHENGIAAHLVVPRPNMFARHAVYGEDLEKRLQEWIATGQVDQVLGDDVGFVSRVVSGHS